MVDAALSIGAAVGVLYSAGFVVWEVGRYAAPQVPESRFDERREMIGYTAGLFVGIPLVLPLLFLVAAFPDFFLLEIIAFLALLVAGGEIAQWLLLRSAYFGRDGAGPFYALGLRAGVGGILVLALVTQYLSGGGITALGVLAVLAIGLAVVALEVVASVLALPAPPGGGGARRGGPLSAVPLEALGFFVVGYADAQGGAVALAGGLLIAAGAFVLYRSIAPPTFDRVSLNGVKLSAPVAGDRAPSPFRRIVR